MPSVLPTGLNVRATRGWPASWLRPPAGARALFAALLAATTMTVEAEQKQSFDGYDVHYAVIPTAMVDAAVAAASGIERAAERALVNVAVRAGDAPRAATIDGTATDLLGRIETLAFREVREGTAAIYYLATMRFTEAERWRFVIHVQPEGASAPYTLRFEQELYGDAR